MELCRFHQEQVQVSVFSMHLPPFCGWETEAWGRQKSPGSKCLSQEGTPGLPSQSSLFPLLPRKGLSGRQKGLNARVSRADAWVVTRTSPSSFWCLSASACSPGPQPSPVACGPFFPGIANTSKINTAAGCSLEQWREPGSEEIAREARQPCPEGRLTGSAHLTWSDPSPHPSPVRPAAKGRQSL